MTLSFLDMNYCRLKSRRQYVHLVPLITWPNIISELFEKAWETREFMPCSISSLPPAMEWGGKSSWNQNQQSTTVLNSHLQGCWYWDDEEAAWQGKPLFRDQLTTMISESDPHKMIFCNFWPIAHFVWSAGELDSPDRQGGFFHQGGAAGVQT